MRSPPASDVVDFVLANAARDRPATAPCPTTATPHSRPTLPAFPAPPTSLVWFRGHDLRVHDHPALDAAVATTGPIVALYVLESGAETDGDGIGQYFRRRSPSPPPTTASVSSCSASDDEHGNYPFDSEPDNHSCPPNHQRVPSHDEHLHQHDQPRAPDFQPSLDPSANDCVYNKKGPLSPTSGFSLGRVPRWYLHHSLLALRDSLSELGITLIIRRAEHPSETVNHVVGVSVALRANAVFWNKRCKPNVYPVDQAVIQRLRDNHIFVKDFMSETFVPFPHHSLGNLDDFQSYTKFCIDSLRKNPPPRPSEPLTRAQVQALDTSTIAHRLQASGCLQVPSEVDDEDIGAMYAHRRNFLPDIDDLELLKDLSVENEYKPGNVDHIGCKAAVVTLKNFLVEKKLQVFSNDQMRRDGMMIGNQVSTSKLSPHIRFGEISPRVLFYSVIDMGVQAKLSGNSSTLSACHIFIKNLTLREFGYYMLKRYPCAAYKPIVSEFNVFPWTIDKDQILQQSWERGLTGFPIIDAAMRQLWREGWLHNKMRFLVASFFVKYLLLPWPIGSTYLVRALVDGDEACNSLGWQWTTGCNSDAFPFSTLINPVAYRSHTSPCHARKYIRKYLPELKHLPDHLLFTPWKATKQEKMRYNLNIVSIQQYRKMTRNQLPPMSDNFTATGTVLYPMRVVDMKQAKGRSMEAMYLMKRIFAEQRRVHNFIVEQYSEPIDDVSDSERPEHGTYTEYMGYRSNYIKSKVTVDSNGDRINEIDLTGSLRKSDTAAKHRASSMHQQRQFPNRPQHQQRAAYRDDDNSSEISSVSAEPVEQGKHVPKRGYDENSLPTDRQLKRLRTDNHITMQQQHYPRHSSTRETLSHHSTQERHEQRHQLRNSAQPQRSAERAKPTCDLLALCEAANQRGRTSPPKRVNRSDSESSLTEHTSVAGLDTIVDGLRSTGGDSDPQRDSHQQSQHRRSRHRNKRPRRMEPIASGSSSGSKSSASLTKGLPVEDLLTTNVGGDEDLAKSSRQNVLSDANSNSLTDSGSLPRLAQVAAIQEPLTSLSRIVQTAVGRTSGPKPSDSDARPKSQNNWNQEVVVAQPPSHPPLQPHTTVNNVENVKPVQVEGSPYPYRSPQDEAANTSPYVHQQQQLQQHQQQQHPPQPEHPASYEMSAVATSSALTHGVYPGMPATTPMVQPPYHSILAAVAAAGSPQQVLIPPYHRHHQPQHGHHTGGSAGGGTAPSTPSFPTHPGEASPVLGAHPPYAATPSHAQTHPSLHSMQSPQGYFPSTAQPFIWYPTMQPYVDMRNGLHTTPPVIPQMINPTTGLPWTAPYTTAMCGYDQQHQQEQAQRHLAQVTDNVGAVSAAEHGHLLSLRGVGLGDSTAGTTPNIMSTVRPSGMMLPSQQHHLHHPHHLNPPPYLAHPPPAHVTQQLPAIAAVAAPPPAPPKAVGPSTPAEREAIARRMAAMDYQDDTYCGKHWEQWQAIALHLLNSYEFSDDTDRETSRAYVRLCVLKDELRFANPSGPRVTVNHCKEVFKILRLPVTGEWDRRGHGGVRGPYVYGCFKRASASMTEQHQYHHQPSVAQRSQQQQQQQQQQHQQQQQQQQQ